MDNIYTLRRIFLACFILFSSSAMAEAAFPDTMNMSSAISNVISQVGKSDYKEIEVVTKGGSLSGEFVKQSGTVLILKRRTNSINMKTNKEKIQYTLIDINSIMSIGFYSLD